MLIQFISNEYDFLLDITDNQYIGYGLKGKQGKSMLNKLAFNGKMMEN